MTTTSHDLTPEEIRMDQDMATNHGFTHKSWCKGHLDGTLTCHRALPPVAGHAMFLMGDPWEDPTICVVPADDSGVVQLTRAELAQVLANADAATGGPR